MNGIILLNKKKDNTSYYYIGKLKKILGIKHIGHTGTLDKNAEGLLVCMVGNACKMQDLFMNGKKQYIAELIFGISTDTQDIVGNIKEKNIKFNIDLEELKLIIKTFIGKYNQMPPMFSSKKVKGQKLLNLAYKGIEIERKKCEVKIEDIEVLDEAELKKYLSNNYKQFKMLIDDEERLYNEKLKNTKRIFIKVDCSKGTYIRTLCNDIGKKLNIPACMGGLIRTENSNFLLSNAYSIEEIEEKYKKNDYSFLEPAFYLKENQVVSFGKFETLHLGHQKIFEEMKKIANKEKSETAVLVIDDFRKKMLSKEQQLSLLKFYGIKNILYFDLNETTKKYSGDFFIKEILIKQMKAKYIVVGEDCSFGINGKNNKDDLIKYFDKNAKIIKKIKINDIMVDIEKTIEENNYENKDKLLNLFSDNKEKYISTTLIKSFYEQKEYNAINIITGRKTIYK